MEHISCLKYCEWISNTHGFVLNSNPLIIFNAKTKKKDKKHTNIQKLKLRQLRIRDFFLSLLFIFFPLIFSLLKFKIHIFTSCIRFTEEFEFIKKKAQFYVSSAFLALWWTSSPGQFQSSPVQTGLVQCHGVVMAIAGAVTYWQLCAIVCWEDGK